jgi:hypothetical protein
VQDRVAGASAPETPAAAADFVVFEGSLRLAPDGFFVFVGAFVPADGGDFAGASFVRRPFDLSVRAFGPCSGAFDAGVFFAVVDRRLVGRDESPLFFVTMYVRSLIEQRTYASNVFYPYIRQCFVATVGSATHRTHAWMVFAEHFDRSRDQRPLCCFSDRCALFTTCQ